MATTVTYKGATLTTVDNATKVLQTAGSWMEDDLTLVDVSGGGGYTIDEIASTEPSGAITITTPTIRKNAFNSNELITSLTLNGTTEVGSSTFYNNTNLLNADLSGMTKVNYRSFYGCSKLTTINVPDMVTVDNQSFYGCKLTGTLKLPNLTSGTGNGAFYGNTLLTKVYIYKTINITYQQNLFQNCTGITDIYVPWSSGAVSGSPWGASNATIHYDTVYDSDGEPT